MVRHLLLASLLLSGTAACAGSGLSSTPTWPKSAGTVIPADWSEDGGESLEPRQPEEVAALDDEDEEEVEEEVEVAAPAAEKTDKPAAATPSGEVSVELQYEEILFEEDASADGDGDGD